jgi:hypothetical protein
MQTLGAAPGPHNPACQAGLDGIGGARAMLPIRPDNRRIPAVFGPNFRSWGPPLNTAQRSSGWRPSGNVGLSSPATRRPAPPSWRHPSCRCRHGPSRAGPTSGSSPPWSAGRRRRGEPPRSYEWSPGTARSLGLYNERAARWEREWPRWPATDTLRYHFGRFSQALEAAGLSARPLVFELSLPERVDAARRLADAGEPTAVIADHLGVHPATVRGYLRARSCRDCGTAVVSGGERCLRCALERRRKRAWTQTEIAEALRAWTAETGAPPTTSEWESGERAAPMWRRERDRWPSAQLVRSRFGSWDVALRAAGYRARWRGGHPPRNPCRALRQSRPVPRGSWQ